MYNQPKKGIIDYEGYSFTVDIDLQAKIFHFREIGDAGEEHLKGTVNGDVSLDDICQRIRETVDKYLNEAGDDAIKPRIYSGKLTYRTDAETHRDVACAAAKLDVSVNRYIESAVQAKLAQDLQR